MAPLQHLDLQSEHFHSLARRNASWDGHWRDDATPEAYITESWSEGFMVGALMIMACITVANMRKGVILHKLILLEVCCVCAFLPVSHPRLISLASSCHIARDVLLHGFQGLWMVSFIHRSVTVQFVGHAQHRRLDQNQAVLYRPGSFLPAKNRT